VFTGAGAGQPVTHMRSTNSRPHPMYSSQSKSNDNKNDIHYRNLFI